MALSVTFKDSQHNPLPTRQFLQGELVNIDCFVSGLLGGGEWGATVTIDIVGAGFQNIFISGSTNFWGHFEPTVTMPFVDAKATVKVHATVFGQDYGSMNIPISIGDIVPDPYNPPVDWNEWFNKYGMWLAGGALLVTGIVLYTKK
jgi:hypothetical protein